ncbi:MAG: PKD-like family lipoprotein [Niabella sp.]
MKFVKYIYLIALISVSLASCYKDKGNYNYHGINEISIKLDGEYAAIYGSRFTIVPVVSSTADQSQNLLDTSKYKYEWSTINGGALYADQRRVLSKNPVLDEVISITPATYTLYLRITDKATGVMWEQAAKLTVTTQIYEGWLILNDVGGQSRLDMLSRSGDNYTFIPSVLDSVDAGLDMSGSPIGVYYSSNAGLLTTANEQGIYISTSKGTNRVDRENFKWNPQLNIKYQFYANVPASFVLDGVFGASGEEWMRSATDNNIYYYYRALNIKYGVPLNIINAEGSTPFKTSRYFERGGSAISGIVFYDDDHKRFVRAPSAQTSASTMPDDDSYFNYNTGMDLKYMQFTPYGNGEVFSVLYDKNTNKNYLARFTFGASIKQTYYAEITGTDFDQAENFAVDPVFGYLFYNVGGKVYEYDMGLKQSFLMLDKGNHKISLLKFHRFLAAKYTSGSSGFPVLANKLVVASYDPSATEGSNGTMELFNVPQVNGLITPYQSYTGFGKIVSLTYRER